MNTEKEINNNTNKISNTDTFSEDVQEKICEFIINPIKAQKDFLVCMTIGTVTNESISKSSQKNTEWAELNLLIESEYSKRAHVKAFKEDAKELAKLYSKNDVVLVIGEPKVNSYVPKGTTKTVTNLDIRPYFIKKLGVRENKNTKPIMK